MTPTLSLPVVFAAGLLSFLSPCFLPVVPVYLATVAGDASTRRSRAIVSATSFVVAFSLVFILLWLFLGSWGTFLATYRTPIRIGAGVLLVFMGLVVAEIVRIPWMQRTLRARVQLQEGGSSPSITRSAILGLAFGAGWTPCIGPVLAGVIALAATSGSFLQGTALMIVYCIGLGLPFVLLAAGASWVFRRIDWVKNHGGLVMKIAGALLIVTGLAVITNVFVYLGTFMPEVFNV